MKNFSEEQQIIEEGLISTAFNVAAVVYITKQMIKPWKDWDAYKLGLIDEKGSRTDKEAKSADEKESLSILNQFIISIRKILLFFMSEGMLKLLVTLYITKSILKK